MNDSNGYLSDDIGRLIEIFIRQWQFIAFATILFAIIAGVICAIVPRSYTATVLIASSRTSSEVSLGSTIETISEEQKLAQDDQRNIYDHKSRLKTYLQMVQNPLVGKEVYNELSQKYSDKMRYLNISDIVQMVDGEILEGSDSIKITFTSDEPQFSADAANSWGEKYVEQVNMIYSSQNDIEDYESIKSQLKITSEKYQTAQDTFENYILNSNQIKLKRNINEIAFAVGQLKEASEVVLNQQMYDIRTSLSEFYDNRQKINSYVEKVEDLKSQIRKGGEASASSNLLALNLMKIELFAKDGGDSYLGENGLVVQTELLTTTSNSMLQDLEGMQFALERRSDEIDEEIQLLSIELLDMSNDTKISDSYIADLYTLDYGKFKLQEFEENLGKMRAELQVEESIERELRQDRDLAWQSYENLKRKAAELEVSLGIKKAAVVFAAPAMVPENDNFSGIKVICTAIAMGIFVGVVVAFVLEFWWKYKGITPHSILIRKRR